MFSRSLSENEIIKISEFVTSRILLEIVDTNTEALAYLVDTRIDSSVKNKALLPQLERVMEALKLVNEKLIQTNDVLELHLQVATVRAGLEKSDRGAYDSMLLGLDHIKSNCYEPKGKFFKLTPRREFEGLARKIDAVMRELELLDSRAKLDDVLNQLTTITSAASSKRERKREVPS